MDSGEDIRSRLITYNTMNDIKVGQVWRGTRTGQKVCVVGVSLGRVFVSGCSDQVDPEWTQEYLKDNYELDKTYA